VAEQILLRRVEGGDQLRVDVGEDGKLVVERAQKDETEPEDPEQE